jgi:hypothetical protein
LTRPLNKVRRFAKYSQNEASKQAQTGPSTRIKASSAGNATKGG